MWDLTVEKVQITVPSTNMRTARTSEDGHLVIAITAEGLAIKDRFLPWEQLTPIIERLMFPEKFQR